MGWTITFATTSSTIFLDTSLTSSYITSGSVVLSPGVLSIVPFSFTLPVNPNNVQDKSIALMTPMALPMSLPFILSYGVESRQLTVQGVIYEAGKTSHEIEEMYLKPLRSVVYRIINLNADDYRYNGDYVLQEFTYTEVAALVAYFTYSMTLLPYSIGWVL